MQDCEHQVDRNAENQVPTRVSEMDRLVEFVDELATFRRRSKLVAIRSHLESDAAKPEFRDPYTEANSSLR
jgi:hypothetical protein